MLTKQRGMTFLGLLIVAIIALSLLLAGIKIVPNYIEFLNVKKTLAFLTNQTNFSNMTNAEIIEAFDKQASIQHITVINGRDLMISTGANGQKIIAAEYEVVEPLAFNLSALMDFQASSAK
jgi:Tfp pilus assembly protein PilE